MSGLEIQSCDGCQGSRQRSGVRQPSGALERRDVYALALRLMRCQGGTAPEGRTHSRTQASADTRWLALTLAGLVGITSILSAQEVARVGEVSIPVEAIRQEIVRSSLDVFDPASATKAADQLIGFELLAEEARRTGLDQDPEVARQIKLLLVETLLAQKVEKAVGEYRPTEADIAAWQAAHPDEVHHPAVARAVILSLWPDASATNRLAERVLEIQTALASGTHLPALASRLSDDPVERSAQPVTFMAGRDSRRYPTEVIQAAFNLTNRNQVAGPVVTSRTTYFVSLVDRRERQPLAPAQAHRLAEQALIVALREELRAQLVSQLRVKSVVTVSTNHLFQALEKPESRPPRGPLSPP